MNDGPKPSPWAILVDWMRRRLRPRRDLVQEMEDLIEEGTAEGVLHPEEEEMLLSVLSLRKTRVREIMVPRTEIVAAEQGDALPDLVRLMVEEGHSRIPVYRGSLDDVIGFVTARDVLRFWGSPPPYPKLETICRPAVFVPETLTLEALLEEFKRSRVPLILAVDEYGGVSGLVTPSDVVEEIVGEIEDEPDLEDEVLETREGYRAAGRVSLEKLEDLLGTELEVDGVETIGGLVFHVLGRVPRPGEVFRYRGLEFLVRDADKRRVKEVLIRRSNEEPSAGETKRP
ncbi:hemolysin family protein [Deferrisoma palaeochoriense]